MVAEITGIHHHAQPALEMMIDGGEDGAGQESLLHARLQAVEDAFSSSRPQLLSAIRSSAANASPRPTRAGRCESVGARRIDSLDGDIRRLERRTFQRLRAP
jgi:hypothetical protein